MAKLKGAYASLIKGVSEQVPHDRLEGQHYEQVNLVSDPIRGLIRRRGSRFLDKIAVPYTPTAAALESLNWYKEHTYTALDTDYSVQFCSKRAAGSNISPVILYDKDNELLVPVDMTTEARNRAINKGISSAVSVGRYLLLPTHNHTTSYTVNDRVEGTKGNASVWIRGGAYARTYRLSYKGSVAEYTTPKSYYEGTLDTSDISYDDAEYQKKVNDRVHAYNTAVNKYIASAQKAITPEEIARNLVIKLKAKGLQCGSLGSHIHIYGLTSATSTLVGTDGGDGSFMRVTHRTVGSLDELTQYHVPGTTIEVEVSADDKYYVKATQKSKSINPADFQEVIWREGPRELISVDSPFLIGTVEGGRLYIAKNSEELGNHLPSSAGIEVPGIVERKSGDFDTNPLPDFFERSISHMTVFQDRLVICSGANVFMSGPGDYFNWFRKSALRVDPDDPIEVYALGAEDDTIRESSLIDRNMILLGDSLHYAVSGRDAITPTNAIVSVQAAHESTTDAAPKALGGLLFYSQFQGGVTKLHQMQVGAFADSFDTFSVTQQITTYLKGRPRQIVSSTQPNMVLLTTQGNDNGLYVFTFLDSPGKQERLFDSWSRWEWHPCLGNLVAVTTSDEGFVVTTLRETASGWYLAVDEFSRDSNLDDMPYLDSRIPYSARSLWAMPTDTVPLAAALSGSHPRRYYGKPADDVGDVLALPDVAESDVHVGATYESWYEPTAPYPRDREGRALLSGRTVLSGLSLTLAQSAGVSVTLQHRGSTEFDKTILNDAGFRINDPLSPLGAVPLTDRQVSCYVGREIREHRLRIGSRSWTPFNIATVEWTLQTFNRR